MRVKVGLFGLGDMLKFKHLGDNREKAIEEASEQELPCSYKANDIAKLYHPYKQYLVIKDIIKENEDTKSFILVADKSKQKELAPFKAGSYLSIYVHDKDNSLLSRTYSIVSSPKEVLDSNEGFYKITIKRVDNGALSNFMLDKATIGMKLESSEPGGFLTYNSLRDSKNVIALAGGVGITPFVSMAKAIVEGIEDFNLTILYGVRTSKDILYKDELLDLINKSNSKVKVIYVFSDEKLDNEEYGFITSELISKYASKFSDNSNYSIFVAGPTAMIDNLRNNELPKLNLLSKYIRIENSPLYLDGDTNVYTIKIITKGKEPLVIKAKGSETILEALERNNVMIRSKCHLGGCGYCRSRLIKGEYASTKYLKLNEVDKKFNYIHPCCSYPRSDLEIEIFEY